MIFMEKATIYNHYGGNWKRTILEKVQWKTVVETSIDSSGKLQSVNTVRLTVPYREGYVTPKEFIGEGFTFTGSRRLDVVVMGEVNKEITESYTISDLKKEFENVWTVFSVADNTQRRHLKHWKVMGK